MHAQTSSCFVSILSHKNSQKKKPNTVLENKRDPGTHPTVAVIVRDFGNNSYFIWEY